MKIHTLFAILGLASLHAQNAPEADPYIKSTPVSTAAPERSGPSITSVCYETFSIPLALAGRLQRERKIDADLYAFLVSAGEKDEVRQESFEMVRCKSGQRATLESITEEIYPTEFEPPSFPGTVGVAISPPLASHQPSTNEDVGERRDALPSGGPNGLVAPATPAAFTTRNVGSNLEVEPTIAEDEVIIDVRINPSRVTRAGRDAWGQGLSRTEMPVFESQQLKTSVTARRNQPTLIGTYSPAPDSKVDPDSAKRVWFAFVTAKIVKP